MPSVNWRASIGRALLLWQTHLTSSAIAFKTKNTHTPQFAHACCDTVACEAGVRLANTIQRLLVAGLTLGALVISSSQALWDARFASFSSCASIWHTLGLPIPMISWTALLSPARSDELLNETKFPDTANTRKLRIGHLRRFLRMLQG